MPNDQTHPFKGVGNMPFAKRYDNFIGGKWVAPQAGRYFQNSTPITGMDMGEIARSDEGDVNLALDAAHAAADQWGRTSAQERSTILLRIADRMEQNLELLATAETWDNGKPIRETMAADVPLAIDHFRYFAGVLRAQEGSLSQIDDNTVAYHFHEPLGVVGQIIPWNFPLLMACWKLAPALAAGNCVVLFLAGLGADHRIGLARVALLDRLGAGDGLLHELLVDRLLHQHARGAGADLALVQREHGEAFQRLVEEVVVLARDVGEEDVGRLAAQLQRHRDQVLGRVLHDQPTGRGLAGEGDLGDPLRRGERLAGLEPEAVDDVQHARRQQVADQVGPDHDPGWGLLGRLQHHAIAAAIAGASFQQAISAFTPRKGCV